MILACLYILYAIDVCTIYTYIYKSTIFICVEISKVLNKVAKEKGCEALLPWIKPCVNHLYWSATSTVDGNGAVIWFLEHIVINQIQFLISVPMEMTLPKGLGL